MFCLLGHSYSEAIYLAQVRVWTWNFHEASQENKTEVFVVAARLDSCEVAQTS